MKRRKCAERKEIEMLVPFCVTGRISVSDARRVENYLKCNPDFAEHIELARDERVATAAVNEVLSFPSARSAAKIFEAIAAEPAPRGAEARAEARGIVVAVRANSLQRRRPVECAMRQWRRPQLSSSRPQFSVPW